MPTSGFVSESKFSDRQKDCWFLVTYGDDQIALTFDDAIEFKIEIAHVVENSKRSYREVQSITEPWRATFAPNSGGFSIAFQHPARSMDRLTLSSKPAARFSEELQSFIDDAGLRS